MIFEENIKNPHESLEKLNANQLSLDESVKIYTEGLKTIYKHTIAINSPFNSCSAYTIYP